MSVKDPRINAYIDKSASFAIPILKRLRKLVHINCPDVYETMKWGFPHFEYHGILCSMAAFKAHAVFGFWKGGLLPDPDGVLQGREKAMGQFGRIQSLKDLPSDKILGKLISAAVKMNMKGVSLTRIKSVTKKKELEAPADLKKVLDKDKAVLKTFKQFSPTHRKEYIEWITEAKTEQTRTRRLVTAVQWISEGKPRNWKYMK